MPSGRRAPCPMHGLSRVSRGGPSDRVSARRVSREHRGGSCRGLRLSRSRSLGLHAYSSSRAGACGSAAQRTQLQAVADATFRRSSCCPGGVPMRTLPSPGATWRVSRRWIAKRLPSARASRGSRQESHAGGADRFPLAAEYGADQARAPDCRRSGQPGLGYPNDMAKKSSGARKRGGGTRVRDAVTGRFLRKGTEKRRPKTTLVERITRRRPRNKR